MRDGQCHAVQAASMTALENNQAVFACDLVQAHGTAASLDLAGDPLAPPRAPGWDEHSSTLYRMVLACVHSHCQLDGPRWEAPSLEALVAGEVCTLSGVTFPHVAIANVVHLLERYGGAETLVTFVTIVSSGVSDEDHFLTDLLKLVSSFFFKLYLWTARKASPRRNISGKRII